MKKRILILDDDTALLEILQYILNEHNYEATLIAETDDLFSLVALHKPVLIILDYRLNGLHGGDWCAKLKAHPEYSQIPVMLLTACTPPLRKGSFGCDDFMTKPFDLYEILEHMGDLINQTELLTGKLKAYGQSDSASTDNPDHHARH